MNVSSVDLMSNRCMMFFRRDDFGQTRRTFPRVLLPALPRR